MDCPSLYQSELEYEDSSFLSMITDLEFLVGVALVTHHRAGAGGEDGVSVEINNTVVATSKQVPSKERERFTQFDAK